MKKKDVILGRIGILGMTPQDISDLHAADRIREHFAAEGKTAVCFGMGNGLDDVKIGFNVEKNIVVSPAALEAAKYLNEHMEHRTRQAIRWWMNWFTIWIIMGKRYLLYSSR